MSSTGGKLAMKIARSIEAEIMERRWPVGQSLGSEPALIERYGVSRAVMREAIRILECHGAAEMRLGPGGGLTVTAPAPELAADCVELVCDHADVSAQNLFEARNAVELTCVRLAAERIDEDGIERLRAVLGDEKDDGNGVHSNRLHLAIAEATGNPVLRLLVELLSQLIVRHNDPVYEEPASADEIRAAHASIVAAVVAGDTPLAQHLFRRHLAATLGNESAAETAAAGSQPASVLTSPAAKEPRQPQGSLDPSANARLQSG